MVFGLSLSAFTQLHVAISLVAIVTGLIALLGMVASRSLPVWTAIFLLLTVLTSATGFLFPIGGLTPALVVGVISILLLAATLLARYGRRMRGAWRWIYVVTATAALYLNVFVLVVQSFQKLSVLHALAPNQTEPPFLVVQSAALIVVVVLGALAVIRFHPAVPAVA
jgi:hypothetical protein